MTADNDNPWGDDNNTPPPNKPERPSDDGRKRPPVRPVPEQDGQYGAIPDLDELFRRSQQNFRQAFPKMGGGGSFLPYMAAVILGLWAISGFYRVESDQVGVELTFGKWTNRDTPSEPGLHYHFPYPIGSVEKPVITRENRITVGFAATGGNYYRDRSARRDVPEESLMLTSDENIVDIDFLVFWRVKDGGAFLFNTRDPELLAKRTAESVMREIVGQRNFSAVMEARADMEAQAMQKMQALLDEYKAGILVQNVQLLDVLPPPPVVDAFNDVQRAQTEKKSLQNQAEAYQNDIVPRARGQAERLRQEAEAYKSEITNRATGDAQRFRDVYSAYSKAPDVTAKRLYLETMEQVLSGANKVVMGKGSNNVLPYLPLPAPGARPAAEPKPAQ